MSDMRSRVYRPFCGLISRPLYRYGGGSSGPCRDFLSAWYDSTITSNGLAYKSKVGEDRDYQLAGSMKWDGIAYLTESSILPTYTTTNNGTAVATLTAGQISYTAGTCWNIQVFDAGGTEVIRCPGVTGDGTTLANVLSDDGR